FSDLLDSIDQSRRAKDRGRAELWIRAVGFASEHGDLRQAVALPRAHGLQRSWLADDRVTCIEGTRLRQTLGSETPDLFISSENQRQRFLQFFKIYAFNRSERRRDECLRVTRAAAVKLVIAFG